MRQAFFVPTAGPYLLSHSVGCLPRSAAAALDRQFFEPWRRGGGDAWSTWLDAITQFRSALAQLLGGAAGDFCPQTNLSSGLAKILPALPATPPERRVLLASAQSFPSMVFALAQAQAFQLRLIPAAMSPAALDTWHDSLTPDVAAAFITHVHSTTGLVAPLADLVNLCRSRGIVSIIDVAQSAGIVPLDLAALDADVVLGSCVKWLCGGPGAGFLWLRPSLVPRLRPTDVGWFSHADPFEFDPGHFEYASDALRFWGGTPSISPFVTATQGLQLLAQIGMGTLAAHNRRLRTEVAEALGAAESLDGGAFGSGGTMCIALGARREQVVQALHDSHAQFDRRGDILRASFHIYNDEADARTLAAALRTGRWQSA